MGIDIKNRFLATPLDRYKYMKMPVKLIPEEFMIEYNLYDKAKEGFIYMEIIRGMYGLPKAGILANKLKKKRLQPHGYYEVKHTPGLFKHQSRPI